MKTTIKKKQPSVEEQLREAIVEACGVQQELEELVQKLDELKSTIREHAVGLMNEGQTTLTINTDLGKCHVTRVKDHLTFAQGQDADVLEKLMPKDLWDRFFVMRPQFRSTAHDAFLVLTDDQRLAMGEPQPFVMQPRLAQVRLPR